MTDPWSVQGTNEVTTQNNLTSENQEQCNQHKVGDLTNNSQSLGFEDSFIQDSNSNTLISDTKNIKTDKEGTKSDQHQPLPDSQSYLQNLERKLEKLKKGSKLVNALSEKRDECLRSMLQDNTSNISSNNEHLLDLDASVTNTDSAVQNLFRQIQPVQPVTVGETVHIVKYDQLEEQRLEVEAESTNNEEQEENLPASR